jgi:signal transduction histidine kinase
MITKIIKIICFWAFATSAIIAKGQTKLIDSLKTSVEQSKTDEAKLKAIFTLCSQWRNLPADTVSALAKQAAALAKDEYSQWRVAYYLNTGLLKKGDYNRVLDHCVLANKWLSNNLNKHRDLEIDYYFLKANALIRTRRYKEAIASMYQLLGNSEKWHDTLTQVKTLSNLGWIYMEMEQYRGALVFFNKAMSLSSNTGLYKNVGVLFSNTASTYNNIGLFDSAFFYNKKAIAIARETENPANLCNALNIEADILLNRGNIYDAGKSLEEAITIRQQLGDPFYTISDMAQLALFYAHNGMQQKGIELSVEAIALARQYNMNAKLPFVYNGLAENYKTLGNFREYSKTLEKILVLKDSLYQQNEADALADLQSRFELQKKENTIMEQKVALVVRDKWMAASVALMAIGLMIAVVLYRFYRNIQVKKIASIQNKQKQETAQAVNQASEMQLRRISAELHDNIGAQISYISSNIDWIVDPPLPISAAEKAERLTSVNEASHALMQNMRETIWALQGNQIMLDEFADKLKTYILSVIKFQPHLRFESSEGKGTHLIKLQPLLALNLFRIFQEAVTNISKHSGASAIRLYVSGKNGIFRVELSDNGKGIDDGQKTEGHYGLRNMQFRAKESGLVLLFKSQAGEGVSVVVEGKAESV